MLIRLFFSSATSTPRGAGEDRDSWSLEREGAHYPGLVSKLVTWCFKSSQQQKDSTRAEGDFQRYTVERTDKAEIRSEEESGKAESCQVNLWNEIQLKGP